MAHISANVNGLSAFRYPPPPACWYHVTLGGGGSGKWKVIDVRRKYEPLVYPDPKKFCEIGYGKCQRHKIKLFFFVAGAVAE